MKPIRTQGPLHPFMIAMSILFAFLITGGILLWLEITSCSTRSQYVHYGIQTGTYKTESDKQEITFQAITLKAYEQSDKVDVLFDKVANAGFSFVWTNGSETIHAGSFEQLDVDHYMRPAETSVFNGKLLGLNLEDPQKASVEFEWKSENVLSIYSASGYGGTFTLAGES